MRQPAANDQINMGKRERSPGKWNFFVLCKKCNERIDIGEAPSPEEAPVVSSIRITCHHCGTEYTYPGEEVGRFRTGRK
jgi:RNase P subunit RPR2